MNRLQDFSLLSWNSFLHPFLKSKFTKKTPWHRKFHFRRPIFNNHCNFGHFFRFKKVLYIYSQFMRNFSYVAINFYQIRRNWRIIKSSSKISWFSFLSPKIFIDSPSEELSIFYIFKHWPSSSLVGNLKLLLHEKQSKACFNSNQKNLELWNFQPFFLPAQQHKLVSIRRDGPGRLT